MALLSVDTEAIQRELNSVAIKLQARFLHEEGTVYATEDLEKALRDWLELSIEALVEDALFHVVEGDCSYAFNRSAFQHQLKKLQPVSESNLIVESHSISQVEDQQTNALLEQQSVKKKKRKRVAAV